MLSDDADPADPNPPIDAQIAAAGLLGNDATPPHSSPRPGFRFNAIF